MEPGRAQHRADRHGQGERDTDTYSRVGYRACNAKTMSPTNDNTAPQTMRDRKQSATGPICSMVNSFMYKAEIRRDTSSFSRSPWSKLMVMPRLMTTYANCGCRSSRMDLSSAVRGSNTGHAVAVDDGSHGHPVFTHSRNHNRAGVKQGNSPHTTATMGRGAAAANATTPPSRTSSGAS